MPFERRIKQVQTRTADGLENWEVGGHFVPQAPHGPVIVKITMDASGACTLHNQHGGSRVFVAQYVVPGSVQYYQIGKIQFREQGDEVVTWRVGEPFFPSDHSLGSVLAITVMETGALYVHNTLGGGVLYGADAFIPDSIEYV